MTLAIIASLMAVWCAIGAWYEAHKEGLTLNGILCTIGFGIFMFYLGGVAAIELINYLETTS